VSISLSPSVSPSVSPSPGWRGYTRGDEAILPLNNDNDLETTYSIPDIDKVVSKDLSWVPQTGLQQFMIHQFKDYIAENSCSLECQLKSDLFPSSSTVYLQIFNRVGLVWDEVDSESLADPNVDFILTGTIANLANYKDASNVISCRVYQEAL